MQPIAVDTDLILSLVENFWEKSSQRAFSDLGKNLEKFHTVYIDKNSQNHSSWWQDFEKIRDSIPNKDIRKLFDDTLGPRGGIRYVENKLDFENALFHKLVQITPDKIGVSSVGKKINEGDVYDIDSFNSTEFKHDNYLFRIPKVINIRPNHFFKDFRLFKPYLINASELEFCDKFLFKGTRFDDPEFVYRLLEIPVNLTRVAIHCDKNDLNLIQKNAKRKIQDELGISNPEFKQYSEKNKNHDRFIIINKEEFSIKLTTSFNNIKFHKDTNVFTAEDAFTIIFDKGRLYFD